MNEIKITVESYPEDPDLLIPVSVAVRSGGDYDLSCYEDTADIVSEYAERFGSQLFAREAVEYLRSRLDPIFVARGYHLRIDDDAVFLLDHTVEPSEKIKVINARDAVGLENLCETDLDEADEVGQEAFVCVEDGHIVAIAVENFTFKGETEIAVETAPDYRRRGYARAAAAALSNDIIASGGRVIWNCSANNLASVALAEAIGFRRDGRELYFCYFEDEEQSAV